MQSQLHGFFLEIPMIFFLTLSRSGCTTEADGTQHDNYGSQQQQHRLPSQSKFTIGFQLEGNWENEKRSAEDKK